MILFERPKNKKRAYGWKYDLPAPWDRPNIEPHPSMMSHPPNFIDEVCMELPHASLKARGLGAWMAVFSIPFILGVLIAIIWTPTEFTRIPLLLLFVNFLGLLILIWGMVYIWRMDTEAPVDEPIRFNRARRKVYVYHFRHNYRRPLSKTDWGVYPEAYDWENLRAEFCSVYAPMGGGFFQFVTLAVLDTDNGQVLERFPFMDGRQEGEMYWAMAQLFMQQGPTAVPVFEQTPRDWNNETHFENIARRLAPKVRWPAQMDLESRTAPEPDGVLSSVPSLGAGGR